MEQQYVATEQQYGSMEHQFVTKLLSYSKILKISNIITIQQYSGNL